MNVVTFPTLPAALQFDPETARCQKTQTVTTMNITIVCGIPIILHFPFLLGARASQNYIMFSV